MAQQEAKQEASKVAAARELNTESLRLTAFLAPTAQVGEANWWADIAGAPPATKTSKPSRSELVQAGALGDCTLTLSVQPGRVDWFLTQRIQEGVLPEGRWAGKFHDTLEVFVPLMTRWLGSCPGLVRLAFGVVVHEPVENRVAGYRKLAQYLPAVRLDTEHSEDFWYQINRPRNSAVVDGLKINRLSRWSAAVLVAVRFVLEKQQSSQQQVGPGEHTCRIELDINTDPAFGAELPTVGLPRLLGELRHLAEELVERGDVA
jgi:hypothetical protein